MTVNPSDGSGAAPDVAPLQPFLHDACVTLHAPSFAVSRPDGQFVGGADGFYHGERRALGRLVVTAEEVPLAAVGGGVRGADRALFRSVLRGLAEATPDPAVVLTRTRAVASGRLTETLEVVNAGALPASTRLVVAAGTDLASVPQVKSGTAVPGAAVTATDDGLRWADDTLTVRLTSTPRAAEVEAVGDHGVLRYDVVLAPGERWRAELVCTVADTRGVPFPAPAPGTGTPWRTPELRSADRRFDRWVDQSHADLERLLLADPERPDELFLAAGAPWFATLFGRDSIWAARMLLPLGTALADSTLRVLARRQGAVVDPRSQEEPGKILHEIRQDVVRLPAQGIELPTRYFGTVDATPLWVLLLHDAWRWGLAPDRVAELLPHAEAALAWMSEHGDADGDGFLEYVDSTGTGLANQGWKDSGDGIRHRDGRLAEPPIALCEVQAYAHAAARGGAALLRAFGRPGADRWEEWADRLATAFRRRFWVEDEHGPYPAVALDHAKRPVDSVTSGLGHLLGTGLLDAEERRLVADRLARPELDCGFGLRTLSSASGGFNPLGYHTGSVWPHDTAIAVWGLAQDGFPEVAGSLAAGLVRAAERFEGRLPELFAGYGADTGVPPAPYPAACRPQAWAATAPMLVLAALLGLRPDVPGGSLRVAGGLPERYRPLRVTGLELAGRPLAVAVATDGTTRVEAPPGIAVRHG
ncbi:glycogen debranching N-terminal domain-containing protein [Streptomyces sp. B6B3]|uniref:amylo-alpha-1,6-glucosidase n=1 Tax=Streptomyces sp. B6B3 TaxID=3153570 RepID=UPI00325D450B